MFEKERDNDEQKPPEPESTEIELPEVDDDGIYDINKKYDGGNEEG